MNLATPYQVITEYTRISPRTNLFLIYINDINEGKNLNLTLFADDILCLIIEESFTQMVQKMQLNINDIQLWCLENDLYISEEKTKIMYIAGRVKDANQIKIWLHSEDCDNENNCDNSCTMLTTTDSIKYLGFTIDNKWNFKNHIEDLIKKMRQITPKLYFLKNILNTHNKKILYDAWIKSYLTYAIELYGFANITSINRLQKTQNKIIKVLFASRHLQTAAEIYSKMNILKIKQLQEYKVLIKNFYYLQETRTIKEGNKTYNTKQTIMLPILVNNKHGHKLRDHYLPAMSQKVTNEIWKLEKIGEIKTKIKNRLMNN